MRASALTLVLALLTAVPLATRAQNIDKPTNDKPAAQLAPAGSASFCLYELPTKDGATRFINLGIVQYVEVNRERLRLTYGGGNFGSGYDFDIPVKSREEGLELIKRIQTTAGEGARQGGSAPLNGVGGRGMGPPNGSGSDTAQPPNNSR